MHDFRAEIAEDAGGIVRGGANTDVGDIIQFNKIAFVIDGPVDVHVVAAHGHVGIAQDILGPVAVVRVTYGKSAIPWITNQIVITRFDKIKGFVRPAVHGCADTGRLSGDLYVSRLVLSAKRIADNI